MIERLSNAMYEQGHRLMKASKILAYLPMRLKNLRQGCQVAWSAVVDDQWFVVAVGKHKDAIDLAGIPNSVKVMEARIELMDARIEAAVAKIDDLADVDRRIEQFITCQIPLSDAIGEVPPSPAKKKSKVKK